MSDPKIDNTPAEYRTPSDAETAAELKKQVREAIPGATDADVAAKTAELKAACAVGWSVPEAGETGKLVVLHKGIGKTVADALADLAAASAPPPPPKTAMELTAEHVMKHRAERQAKFNPATSPSMPPADKPWTDLTTAEHMARWRAGLRPNC